MIEFAEQRQRRVAVTAGVIAEHLVVGAVLAHDVEDVLDRPARADRRVRRRGASVGGDHLAVADRGELADLPVAGIVQDAGGAVDDRGQVLVEVGVVAGVRVGTAWVGTDAETAGRDPDELAALRRRGRHRRIAPGRDPPDELEGLGRAAMRLLLLALASRGRLGNRGGALLPALLPLLLPLLGPLAAALALGESEDRHGVLAGVGGEQIAAVRGHAHVGREVPDALRPFHRERPRHRQRLGVDHGDRVLVRVADEGQLRLRIDGDALGMRERRGDLDALDHLCRRRGRSPRRCPASRCSPGRIGRRS